MKKVFSLFSAKGDTQSSEAPRKSPNKLSKPPRTNTTSDGSPIQKNIQRQDSSNQLTPAQTIGSSLDLDNAVQPENGSVPRKPEGRSRLRDSLLRSRSSAKKRRNTLSNIADVTPMPVDVPTWSEQLRPNSMAFEPTPSASPVLGMSRPSSRSRPSSMLYEQQSRPASVVFELAGDTSFFEEDHKPQPQYNGNQRSNRSSGSFIQARQPRLSLMTEHNEQSNAQESAQQPGRYPPGFSQAQRSASTSSIPPSRRRSMLAPGMATRTHSYEFRHSMAGPPPGQYHSPDDIKGHYFADFSTAAPASFQDGTPEHSLIRVVNPSDMEVYDNGGYKRGSLRITNGHVPSPEPSPKDEESQVARIKPNGNSDADILAPESETQAEDDASSGDDDKPLTMALVPSSRALALQQQRPSSRSSRSSKSSRSSPKLTTDIPVPALPLDSIPPRVGPSTPLGSNPPQALQNTSTDFIDFSAVSVPTVKVDTSHNELALTEFGQRDSPTGSLELAKQYQQVAAYMLDSAPNSRSTTPGLEIQFESKPPTRPVSPAYPLRLTDGQSVPPSPVSPNLTPSNSSAGSSHSTAVTSRTSGSNGTFGRAAEVKPITKIDSPYGSAVSLRSLGRSYELRQKESKRVSWSGDFQELPTVPDKEAPPMPKLPPQQQRRGQQPPRNGHRRTSSGPITTLSPNAAEQQQRQQAAARSDFYQNAESDSRSSLPSMTGEFSSQSVPSSPSMSRKWVQPRPLSQSIINAQGARHTGQPHIPPVPEEQSLRLEDHMRSQSMAMRPNMGRSESRGTLTTITSMGTEEEHEQNPATSSLRPNRVSSPPSLIRQKTAPSRVSSAPPVNAAPVPSLKSPAPAPAPGPLRRSMTADMTRPMTSSAFIEMPILRNFDEPPKPKARPTSMFIESTFKLTARKEEAEKKEKEKAEKAEKAAKAAEKPERPKIVRRRTYHEDELAPLSPAEWEHSITSYDHLGPGLGFSPYDLASASNSPLANTGRSYFEPPQPVTSPKPRGRATGMDAEAASEFARQKSRLRESSRRRSRSQNRLSLDLSKMSGALSDPIYDVTSPGLGDDAPPVPELPNKLRNTLSKKKTPPPVSMSATLRKPVGSGSPRDQNRSAPLPNRSSNNPLDQLPPGQVLRPATSYGHGDQPDTWDPKTRSWVQASNAPMSANDQLLQNRARRMSENQRPATSRTSSSRPVSMNIPSSSRPVSMISTSSRPNSIYGSSSPAAESYSNLPGQLMAAKRNSASVESVVIVRSHPTSTRPSMENLRINTGINSGRPSLERLRDSIANSRANSARPSLENLRANTYNNSGRSSPVYIHQRAMSERYLPQSGSRPISGDWSQARPRPRPQSQYSRSRPVSGDFGSGVNADGGMMVIDRYQGGLNFGYEKGFGLGGSAGTRGPESGASRKSLDESSMFGLDFSDIPMIAY